MGTGMGQVVATLFGMVNSIPVEELEGGEWGVSIPLRLMVDTGEVTRMNHSCVNLEGRRSSGMEDCYGVQGTSMYACRKVRNILQGAMWQAPVRSGIGVESYS